MLINAHMPITRAYMHDLQHFDTIGCQNAEEQIDILACLCTLLICNMSYGLVNVPVRIASIYTHDLLLRCDIIGCHNAE